MHPSIPLSLSLLISLPLPTSATTDLRSLPHNLVPEVANLAPITTPAHTPNLLRRRLLDFVSRAIIPSTSTSTSSSSAAAAAARAGRAGSETPEVPETPQTGDTTADPDTDTTDADTDTDTETPDPETPDSSNTAIPTVTAAPAAGQADGSTNPNAPVSTTLSTTTAAGVRSSSVAAQTPTSTAGLTGGAGRVELGLGVVGLGAVGVGFAML